MKRIGTLLLALSILFLATPAVAQQKTLRVGSSAPGLDIESWVHGDAVAFEEGRVYVVCFWSLESIRSTSVMAMLDSIQGQLLANWTPVTTVAITGDDSGAVNEFIRRSKRDIELRTHIAIDRRGETYRKWAKAAEYDRLPAVFLIDKKGKIQFIGNPFVDEEAFASFIVRLGLVIEDRFDAVLYSQTARLRARIDTMRRMRNWRMANVHIDKLLETDRRIFALIHIERFEMMLLDQDKKDEAYAYARQLVTEYGDDPGLLAQLGTYIATSPKIPEDKRDLDVALELVDAAAKVTTSESPYRYATLALVHFERGEIDKAVAMQRQAYRVALPMLKDQLRHDLDRYILAQREARRKRTP